MIKIKKPRQLDIALIERILKRLDDDEEKYRYDDFLNGRSTELPRVGMRAVAKIEADALRRVLVILNAND